MSNHLCFRCLLKVRSVKSFFRLILIFALVSVSNVISAQSVSSVNDQLRTAYEKIVNPEISFERFAEINSHVYANAKANTPAAILAFQDTYCSKVRQYCTNGDFESGLDQNQWTGAYGTDGTGILPNPFILTYGFIAGAINSSASHQTIVDKSGGNDPTVPIPLVAANGGNKALRLGNNINGNGTEVLAKSIVVDANETILSFYYAVVFEDPGHSPNDQPAFSVRAYDCATGAELPNVCNLGNGSNVVVSNSQNPFFQSANGGSIAYRNWSLAQINLSAYVGKTVIIVFETKDCNLGGHYGYAYLDNIFSGLCPVGGPILTGQGSISLNSATSSTCGTGQICVNYTLPTTNTATGSTNISLDIFQSGIKVTTLTSGNLTAGTSYCFTINPALLGLNGSLNGFDYSLTGNFSLSGFSLAPIIVGNPPNGQISGANNDYLIACPSSNVYYSKPAGDLHNVLTWGLNPDGSGINPADFSDSIFQLANRPSGLYIMTADWTVGGTINIPTSSRLQVNANTLSLTELAGAGTISGSSTSNLSVIGTAGGNVTLNFTPAANLLNNFTINRLGIDAAATINNALNILNVLTLTMGTLNTGGFLTLKSTAAGTARVAPVTGSIAGNVVVERYIPARRAWRILSAPVGGTSGATNGQATLTHSQEPGAGPLTTSTGDPRPLSFGTATFSLNAAHTAMTFTATVTNIDINGTQTSDPNDNLTAAHIHVGAFPGANAPVRWGFFGSPLNDNNPPQLVITPFASGVGGTFSSTWDLPEGNGGTTLATNLPGIFAGQAYINFHTTQFGGGEIRGQISMTGAGTQTINQAWQEGAILGLSANSNPIPNYGTHITGGFAFGSTANGFDQNPGAASSIKTYNSSTNNWAALPNTNATGVGADAYMTFVRGNRGLAIGDNTVAPNITTLRASGPLKVGDQVFPVSGSGFTGIPNPFASPINFATITRVGVNQNFYLWDPKMGGDFGVGAYVLLSFNGTTYDVIPASVSPESQYIQSGQGFLVSPSTPGVAGTVTIKESDKTATVATDVFRVSSGATMPAANVPKLENPMNGQGLRIDLQVVENNQTTPVLDEIFSSYNSSYSDRLDNMDAVKMSNEQENLGIVREGQTLMLERKMLPTEKDIIALKLWNTSMRNYALEFNPVNLTGTGLIASLEDAYLHTSTPVSLTEVSRVYFSITNNPASASANRFKVVLVNKNLLPDAITSTTGKRGIVTYPNPVSGKSITLYFTNEAAGTYQVSIFNSIGQAVFTKSIQHEGGSYSQELRLNRKLEKGVYQMHVSSATESANIKLISN